MSSCICGLPKSIKPLCFFRGNLNVNREFCLEQTAPAATASRQPVQSNREMMKEEDLDRYYAKPGEAEWGC